LTLLTGPSRGQNVPLGTAAFRIGRDPNLEHPINDSRASRVHLEIVFLDNNYLLRDLKSKNGTLVNGAAVSTHALMEGDQIQIGETKFAFSMQSTPESKPVGGGRQQMDSVVAARLPVGAVPALGTAGMTRSAAAKTFETIELSAPLAILRGQETGNEHAGRREARSAGRRQRARAVKSRARCTQSRGRRRKREQRGVVAGSTERWLLSALEADRVTPVLIEGKNRWRVAEPAAERCGRTRRRREGGVRENSGLAHDRRLRAAHAPFGADRAAQRRAIRARGNQSGEQGIHQRAVRADRVARGHAGIALCRPTGRREFCARGSGAADGRVSACGPALSNLQRLEDALTKKTGC